MLRFGQHLKNLTLMSLRIGYPVGTATEPIVNPHNLTVLGFFAATQEVLPPAVILAQNIREFSGNKLIIDSEEEVVPLEDLLRDKEIISLNYQLIGKKVVTESKIKLGKVEEFVINNQDFVIYKLHVATSGIRSLAGGKLVIDRNQVVATYDDKIVVKDNYAKVQAPATPSLVSTPS